jgi:cell division protein FtsI/penicillin-binding protein 2
MRQHLWPIDVFEVVGFKRNLTLGIRIDTGNFARAEIQYFFDQMAKSSDPTAKEWRAGEMVSVSIGQGYNAYTPLQMAHATASLANNGVVYQPHLVKEVLDFGARKMYKRVRHRYGVPYRPVSIPFPLRV